MVLDSSPNNYKLNEDTGSLDSSSKMHLSNDGMKRIIQKYNSGSLHLEDLEPSIPSLPNSGRKTVYDTSKSNIRFTNL